MTFISLPFWVSDSFHVSMASPVYLDYVLCCSVQSGHLSPLTSYELFSFFITPAQRCVFTQCTNTTQQYRWLAYVVFLNINSVLSEVQEEKSLPHEKPILRPKEQAISLLTALHFQWQWLFYANLWGNGSSKMCLVTSAWKCSEHSGLDLLWVTSCVASPG